MDAWGLLKELRDGWPAVRAARWVLFVALIAGTAIGFSVATLWWSGTVSTLRERLSFSQDKLQIALANPSNPAALLTKEPGRHLAEKDRQCLVESFKDANGQFKAIFITAFPDDEARKYAAEFLNLFLRMGFRAGILEGNSSTYSDIGVMIGLKNEQNPSDEAKKFVDLMSKCEVVNHKTIRFSPPPNLLPEVANLDFDLYIGPRE